MLLVKVYILWHLNLVYAVSQGLHSVASELLVKVYILWHLNLVYTVSKGPFYGMVAKKTILRKTNKANLDHFSFIGLIFTFDHYTLSHTFICMCNFLWAAAQ